MLDACGIQAIANISRMQWLSSMDHVLRGYDFAYEGSFDFKDGANADVEYFYDANGALVKDLNKGISNIEYDILGNLKCITFSNDFKTKYVYDAAGNKLRTTHESVVTNTTEGNCNTSTTTLLKKAGVSDGEINRIKNQIPEFKTGFGDVKPWSDEERKEAFRQKIKLAESLDNSLR